MLHVVLMLFQEINKHSYGRLCCSPLTMHILFRPCGLTLNKRNDRQRIFFSGVRIRLGMIFNYLILWVRVKGQG